MYWLALLAEAAVFHWRVLFREGFVFPWDFRAVHLPLASFVADSFQRGEFPLWDPFTYCGNPIYANIQTALFYPPVSLATLASNWLGPERLPRLLAAAAVLQICFAGLCTYALLRRLGAHPAAAWIAGSVYELGCFFASQAQHSGAVHAASWLPLAWLCVIALRDGLRGLWLALLSVALAMSVLAGLPQVAVAVFGSSLALALVLPLFGLARRTLPLHVLLAWAWALALTAVQVIPTTELTRNSVAKFRAEWLKSGGGIRLEALYSLFSPDYWSVFDLTRFHGPSDPTFLYLYSGILTLALAAAAMCWKPDRWSRAFTLLTGAACLWMLGDATPAGRAIFLALPISIRIGIHPEFTLCVFSLGLAVLAGWGAHRLLPSARWRLAAGVFIAIDLIAVSSGRPFNTASLAVEPGITRDSADGSRELISRLRSLTATATPPYRFDMTDASLVWSSTAPLYEIPTANGCDPLAPERVIQLRLAFSPGARWGTCYQVVDPSSPALNLANVRYLLSRTPIANPAVHQVASIHGHLLYENPRVLPRYFLVQHAIRADGLAGAAQILRSADFDPSHTAIVEHSVELTGAAAQGDVEVVSFAASSVRLISRAEAPSLLIAADAFYPGWEARVDGRPAPIFAANVAFRAIPVPAGEHGVEMRFVPRVLYYSAFFSALAWLAVAGVVLRSAR